MPTRDGAPRIPVDLGVVVRVEIDEAGSDDGPIGINDLVRGSLGPSAHLGDTSVLDPKIAPILRCTGAIDDGPVLDVDVVVGHKLPLVQMAAFLLPDRTLRPIVGTNQVGEVPDQRDRVIRTGLRREGRCGRIAP